MSTLASPVPFAAPLVGTTSAQAIGQNLTRASMFVYNPSATATIGIAPTGSPAVLNGANTLMLAPLTGAQLDAWTTGMNAVASSPSTPIAIYEFPS